MFCICHFTGDIADFDNDDKIGKKDLAQVINCLTLAQWPNTQRDKPLSNSEMGDLIKNVSAKLTLDLVADWLMLRFCIALWYVNASVKLLVI